MISRWLWTGELLDCLEAGYVLLEIRRGYGFQAMSDFMCRWVDLLWDKYQQARDEWIKEVIKSMMVGLPGRFLRQPETYHLIPLEEASKKNGDIPLMMHWKESEDRKFSGYAIRAEYEKESTALSYIGSYIVAEMRRELYHRMKEEVAHGYRVVGSYIDCYRVYHPATLETAPDSPGLGGAEPSVLAGYGGTESSDYRNVGTDIGQWKEKTYSDVFASGNRFIGLNELSQVLDLKAPGLEREGTARLALYQQYYEIVKSYPL